MFIVGIITWDSISPSTPTHSSMTPSYVIVKVFYLLLLAVSRKLGISFLNKIIFSSSLLERLYLFTLYALPLTIVPIAFGSDSRED